MYAREINQISKSRILDNLSSELVEIYKNLPFCSENEYNLLLERAIDIEQELFQLAPNEKTGTPEEWDEYIETVYIPYCSMVAKLEAQTYNNGNKESNQKQKAVVIGGQPGAGKSPLIELYIKLLKEEFGIDALGNNADDYRECIPHSDKLMRQFPGVSSKITDKVVKAMRKGLIDEAISQRISFVLENTLGDTIAADQIINAGIHEVWIAIMAVPREESLISNFERYIKMKNSPNEVPRLVSIEAHDKRYKALDENIKKLYNLGARIRVHSRGKTENHIPSLVYDSEQQPENYKTIKEIIETTRRKYLEEHIHRYQERLDAIEKNIRKPDERNEFNKLKEIIEKAIEEYNKNSQVTEPRE